MCTCTTTRMRSTKINYVCVKIKKMSDNPLGPLCYSDCNDLCLSYKPPAFCKKHCAAMCGDGKPSSDSNPFGPLCQSNCMDQCVTYQPPKRCKKYCDSLCSDSSQMRLSQQRSRAVFNAQHSFYNAPHSQLQAQHQGPVKYVRALF